MKRIILSTLLIGVIFNCGAQCPIIEFTLSKDTACLGEEVDIINKTKNAINFEWSFCTNGFLSNDFKIDSIKTKDKGNLSMFIDIIDTVIYAFLPNWYNNYVLKIKFDTSMNVIDTSIINMQKFGNGLYGMDIVKIDSIWYGFVCGYYSNNIVVMNFGKNLDSNPELDTLQFVRPIKKLSYIDAVYQNDSLFLFCTSETKSDSLLTLVFTNPINLPVMQYGIKINGANSIRGLRIIRECENWYGLITSFGDNKLFKLSFGSNLTNNPTIFNLGNGGGLLDVPLSLDVINSNSKWIAFIANYNEGLVRVNFEDDFNNNSPTFEYLGNIANIATYEILRVFKYKSSYLCFVANIDNYDFRLIQFEESCFSNIKTSSEYNINNLRYFSPGIQTFSLLVEDSNNITNSVMDSIFIKGIPNADFLYYKTCLKDSVNFFNNSSVLYDTINSYVWSFDDNNISNVKNPIHYYNDSLVNTYNVKLVVSSSCSSDSLIKKVKIINKPLGIFTTSNFCTDSTYYFYDKTIDTLKLHDFFFWLLHNGQTYNLQNPSHLYSDTGKFQITFITGVEGCTDTIIDTITFYPKPVANFNTTDICIGDSTNFNDSSSVYLSSLTPINKWSWNLGDTNTDTNQFPKHLYADSGKYQISLIVTTSKNCSDTITKSIDIQKPLAKFLIKEKICDNFPIPFIDTSTVNADSIVSWEWSFVSGDSSVSQYPTYSFPDSGIFNIYLKVKSSQNCTHDTVIPIYVNLGPTVAFSFDTVCAENQTSFSDNSTIVPSDTIISWAWNFGDSSFVDSSKNTKHTYSDGAKYAVTLNVATQKGCKGIKVNNIIAKPLPVVNFGYSTVCVNNDVNFYDYSSVNNVLNDSIASWKWFFDDGNSSTLQNPVNLYTSSTTKNVLLIAYTNNNCFDSLVKPVAINPLPVIDYTYTDVCEPETTFFVSSTSIYNLFWTFGDTASGSKNKSTAINPTHLYKIADNYFVNLIAVSNDNCTTKVDKTVSVSHIPTANFITNSICKIYPANFFDSSYVTQASITEWKWDFDDGTSLDTIQNPTHSFSDTGKYTINLIIFSEKGCSSEVSKNIQVFQLPDANFDFTPQFGIPPLNVSFKNKTNEAISYKWYFGDGDTSLDANPSHTYTDTGEYIIKFYVINEYGCIDTLRDLIRVKAPVLDLIINELLLKLNSNYYESTVNFTNIGNRDIETINFELAFVNGNTVSEEWTGSLLPSKNDTYIFSSKTKSESLNQSDIVCVSATLINYEQDDKPDDNKQCVTLNKEIDILSPIYDYENNTVILQIISNKKQTISINFYDQLGKVLHEGNVTCNEGYNTVEISVARQQAGLYIYTINSENESLVGKVTILN